MKRIGSLLLRIAVLLMCATLPVERLCAQEPLVDAAARGDGVTVSRLLNEGHNIEATDDSGRTALIAAASHGRTDVVKILLLAKANPDAMSKNGASLHFAAGNGSEGIVGALIFAGANVNARIPHLGFTPLMNATANGHEEVMEELLAAHADINAQDSDGWTPLMHAIWWDHRYLVQPLVEHGADLNVEDKVHETALIKAAQRGFTADVEYLKEHGARETAAFIQPPETTGSNPWSPEQARALAAAAVLVQVNGGDHSLLGGAKPSEARNLLRRNYSELANRTQILAFLDQLNAGSGDRQAFDAMDAEISKLPDGEFNARLGGMLDDPVRIVRWKLLRRAGPKATAGGRSILAWDLCRQIYVAGLACDAGFIQPEEAWGRILPASEELRKRFSSWQDMADNFLLGCQFASIERPDRYVAVVKLLTNSADPNSPWTKNPW